MGARVNIFGPFEEAEGRFFCFRLSRVKVAKDGITAYYYGTTGRKISEVLPKYYDDNLPMDEMNRVVYTYDQMDRVTAKMDKYIDPVSGQWVTLISRSYTYDKNGNLVKEQDAWDGKQGKPTPKELSPPIPMTMGETSPG